MLFKWDEKRIHFSNSEDIPVVGGKGLGCLNVMLGVKSMMVMSGFYTCMAVMRGVL